MTEHDAFQMDCIDSLTDPEMFSNNSDVTIKNKTAALPPEHFRNWRNASGFVGIGVRTERGELLLWDGTHGWTLPYVEVSPGEDYAVVAREAIETLTSMIPTLSGVERATRMEYVLNNGDDSVTTYEVIFRAEPVDEGTAAKMVAGEDASVRWVTELNESNIVADDPEDIDGEADGIRQFLGYNN